MLVIKLYDDYKDSDVEIPLAVMSECIVENLLRWSGFVTSIQSHANHTVTATCAFQSSSQQLLRVICPTRHQN